MKRTLRTVNQIGEIERVEVTHTREEYHGKTIYYDASEKTYPYSVILSGLCLSFRTRKAARMKIDEAN